MKLSSRGSLGKVEEPGVGKGTSVLKLEERRREHWMPGSFRYYILHWAALIVRRERRKVKSKNNVASPYHLDYRERSDRGKL